MNMEVALDGCQAMQHEVLAVRAHALWELMSVGGKRDNFRAVNRPPEYYWKLAEDELRKEAEHD